MSGVELVLCKNNYEIITLRHLDTCYEFREERKKGGVWKTFIINLTPQEAYKAAEWILKLKGGEKANNLTSSGTLT